MSVDFRSNNREVLEEFIDTYKSEPCLWRVKSKDYHNKKMRDSAYIKLIDVLKKIDPNADRERAVKKINSLRTNYRKEKAKLQKSKCSASGALEVHKTKLWYFDLFEFLEDQEDGGTSSSLSNTNQRNENNDEESFSNSEETDIDIDSAIIDELDSAVPGLTFTHEFNTVTAKEETNRTSFSTLKSTSNYSQPPNKRKSVQDKTDNVLETFENNFKKPKLRENRYEIFGKYVSVKLRDIKENTQRLLAEKIINDALFMAEMNQLTLSNIITLAYSDYHSTQIPNPNEIFPQNSTTQTHSGSENVRSTKLPRKRTRLERYGSTDINNRSYSISTNEHYQQKFDAESSTDEDSKKSLNPYVSDNIEKYDSNEYK